MAQTGAAFTEYAALEWRFKRWRGRWNGGSWVTLGHLNPQEITLTDDLLLRGEFEKYYLPDDLQALLNYLGLGLAVRTTTVSVSEPCNGHYIPDVVYMALVDWMLDNEDAPLHAEASAAYWENMAALQGFFGTVEQQNTARGYTRPDTPVISALAAAAVYSQASYATLRLALYLRERVLWGRDLAMSLLSFPALDTLPGLAACADVDGDGFSNAEEWLYWNWNTGGGFGTIENWTGASSILFRMFAVGPPVLEAGYAAYVPDMTIFANTPGAPPTVTVTIVREGDGGLVYPPQGTYQLPKYNLTDWWVRNPDGSYSPRADQCAECEASVLSLRTGDYGDWAFRWWFGEALPWTAEMTDLEKHRAIFGYDLSRSKTMVLDTHRFIEASFVERPGIADLDLHADVVEFLEGTGAGSAAAYYDLVFDAGDFDCTEDGLVSAGNGVPDYLEVDLLNHVLTDVTCEQGAVGGICHEFLWETFSHNLALVESYLPNESGAVHRAVAAFMSLSVYGHQIFVNNVLEDKFQVTLPVEEFENTAVRWIEPDGDVDGDGATNEEEYAALVDEELPVADIRMYYAVNASDPSVTAAGTPPNANESSNDECWSDVVMGGVKGVPQARTTITLTSEVPDSTVSAVFTPSDGVLPVAGGPGEVKYNVPVGRKMEVSLVGNSVQFLEWHAPYTTLERRFEDAADSTVNASTTVVHARGQSPTIMHASSNLMITPINSEYLESMTTVYVDNMQWTRVEGYLGLRLSVLNRDGGGISYYDSFPLQGGDHIGATTAKSTTVTFRVSTSGGVLVGSSGDGSLDCPKIQFSAQVTNGSAYASITGRAEGQFTGGLVHNIVPWPQPVPRFGLTINPAKGYSLYDNFEEQNIGTWETYYWKAKCIPLSKLDITIKRNGLSSPGESEFCAGSVACFPYGGYYYYPGRMVGPFIDKAATVHLEAQPRHGYYFWRWHSSNKVYEDDDCTKVLKQDTETDGVKSNPHPAEIWVRMDSDVGITAEFKACEHCQTNATSTTKFISSTGGTRFPMQSRSNVAPAIYGRYSDDRDLPTYDDWACYNFVDKKLYNAFVAWQVQRLMNVLQNPLQYILNPNYLTEYLPRFNDIGEIARRSHKAGLSADIRYFNKSGGEFDFDRHSIDNFDKSATDALISILAAQGEVLTIEVSKVYPNPLPSGAERETDNPSVHESHFHMGYNDPD